MANDSVGNLGSHGEHYAGCLGYRLLRRVLVYPGSAHRLCASPQIEFRHALFAFQEPHRRRSESHVRLPAHCEAGETSSGSPRAAYLLQALPVEAWRRGSKLEAGGDLNKSCSGAAGYVVEWPGSTPSPSSW